MGRESMNDEDPWGSPALHKNHNHVNPETNGTAPQEANGAHSPIRTSSTFTTDPVDSGIQNTNQTSESRPSVGSLWESYDGGPTGSFQNSADSGLGSNIFGDGPGGDDEGRPPPSSQSRALGGRGFTSSGPDENILVTLMPEKEGVFMFQHHNYQVSSIRRNSKVIRRYSDFVWLLDCLHKRYPFRQLPLLPPKRVGGMFRMQSEQRFADPHQLTELI
jgi:sorting nexin-8